MEFQGLTLDYASTYPFGMYANHPLLIHWAESLVPLKTSQEEKEEIRSYMNKKIQEFVNEILVNIININKDQEEGWDYLVGIVNFGELKNDEHPLIHLIQSIFTTFHFNVHFRISRRQTQGAFDLAFLSKGFMNEYPPHNCKRIRLVEMNLKFRNREEFKKVCSLDFLLHSLDKIIIPAPTEEQKSSKKLPDFLRQADSCEITLKWQRESLRVHRAILEATNLDFQAKEIQFPPEPRLSLKVVRGLFLCLYRRNLKSLEDYQVEELLQVQALAKAWGIPVFNECDYLLQKAIEKGLEHCPLQSLMKILKACSSNPASKSLKMLCENKLLMICSDKKKFNTEVFGALFACASEARSETLLQACCILASINRSYRKAFQKGLIKENWLLLFEICRVHFYHELREDLELFSRCHLGLRSQIEKIGIEENKEWKKIMLEQAYEEALKEARSSLAYQQSIETEGFVIINK